MKKAISLILSAAFVCSLFAACSDKSVNEDGNNKSSENNIELKITIDAHYSSLDESSIKAYEKLCNAVLNYKSEVKYNV